MNKSLRSTLSIAGLTFGMALATAGAGAIDWPSIGGGGKAVVFASAAGDSSGNRVASEPGDIDWPIGPATRSSTPAIDWPIGPAEGDIDWP
ncbi:hypothetical protein [Streptomyces anulatus]|uniref:hypothetical protein n=1 Tax=Streptomyces anulatus TaxID=1892 RepID=UPI003331B974